MIVPASAAFWAHLWLSIIHLLQRLGVWSYVLLGATVMVEGPITTLVGAAAAAAGVLKPGYVFVAAATGNLTGDVLWYSLGRCGQVKWLLRGRRLFALDAVTLRRWEERIRENAPRMIFIAKVTLFFALPAFVAAGLTRARMRKWLPVDFAAEVLWTGTLVTVGYYFTAYLREAVNVVRIGSLVAAGAGAVVALIFVRRLNRRALC